MTAAPTLRVARPTDQLDDVVRFYEAGLGMSRLGSFQDHDGFDGVMLGLPGADYHLEFTRCRAHAAGRAPTLDNLLVFYLPNIDQWTRAIERMTAAGYVPVPSLNPYWDRNGRTFEDPDGYRVVLQNASWPGVPGAGARVVERLERIPPGPARDPLLPMISLADDAETQVRAYYQQGDLFVLRHDDAAVGIVLAIPLRDGEVELKAVAVTTGLQGRGIGSRMLSLVLDSLRAAGSSRVIVGTATCGIGQLAFYQKAGFRLRKIERDFFTAERGYPPGIEENGIPLRDMAWMDRELRAG